MHQTRKHALCWPKHIIASHIKSIKDHICQTGGILHPFSGSQLERWNKNCCSHLPEIAVKVWATIVYISDAKIKAPLTNGNWKDKRSCITNLNSLLMKQPHPEALSSGASLQPLSISLWKHSGIPKCYCLHCSPTHILTLTLTNYLAC